MRKNHSKVVCIKLVHLPYLYIWCTVTLISNSLTPLSRVLLEKLSVSQLVEKFSAVYGTGSSLPLSQVPAICPYSESDQSCPCPSSNFLKLQFNIIFPSMPGFSRGTLPLMFPHQNPVCTSPLPHMRYMPTHLLNLDLITQIILGEQYRSLRSHYVVYSTPLSPRPS